MLLKNLLIIFLTAAAAVLPINAAMTAKVDALVRQAYDKGEFSGVILVEKNGKVIYQAKVGLANRAFNLPNEFSTKFRICSVTKQFTAVLTMQLVEAGKIDLEKSVAHYLPEFRKDTGGRIKIRDLLLSASGLPVLPDDFYVNEDSKLTQASFVIGRYLQGDLTFQPGEKFNYNNGDFVILGAIIEKVTGRSYQANLNEKVLKPLGMKDTGLLKDGEIIPNLAGGYSFKGGRYLNEGFVQIQNFGAAGAMYSTAGDLQIWNRALLLNRVLSKKFTDEMFTPSPKLGFVGLGSWVYDLKLKNGKSTRAVERQGYINGFCALNVLLPAEGVSAVFLSNTETQTLFQTYASRGLSFDVLNGLLGQ